MTNAMKKEKPTIFERRQFARWAELSPDERSALRQKYPNRAYAAQREYYLDERWKRRQAEIEEDRKNGWVKARAREEELYKQIGTPEERDARAQAAEQLRRQREAQQRRRMVHVHLEFGGPPDDGSDIYY